MHQDSAVAQSKNSVANDRFISNLTDLYLQEIDLNGKTISEALWSQVYAALKIKSPEVVSDYEQCLYPHGENSGSAARMDDLIYRTY